MLTSCVYSAIFSTTETDWDPRALAPTQHHGSCDRIPSVMAAQLASGFSWAKRADASVETSLVKHI